MKRLIGTTVLAAATLVAAPQVASAHKPIISGSASCADDGWSVTWTITPSGDHPDLLWEVKRPSGAYTPGKQAADISSSFTRTTNHAAGVTSVTETVWADWTDPGTGLVIAQSTRSATVQRPEGCTESAGPTTTLLGSAGPTTTLGGRLPSTGSESTQVGLWIGGTLLAAGFGLTTVATRRKRPA